MIGHAAARMRSQHGLITFVQAVDSGLRPAQINALLKQGRWVRVRPGVYAEADLWASLDPWIGQPALRARATHMVVRIQHWLSHDSAIALHGLSLIARKHERVHLTRPDRRGRQVREGLTQHGAKVHETEMADLDGLPVLSLARTALDVVREHGFAVGLGACDQALRAGVTRDELEHAAAMMWGWPFSVSVREAVLLADAQAENPFESAARALVLELGIGIPETQFGLSDGNRSVYCDMRVGRHVFEADGKVKLTPVALGGYAPDPTRALWEEKKRQDFVTGFKLGMSRITYADLFSQRDVAKRRLTREYDDTVARFGTSIADLAPYILRRAA